MSKRFVVLAFLCAGLIAACGGGSSDSSGVARSKSLASLSDDEITDLCEYFAEAEVRTIDCGDGLTITIEPNTVTECVTKQQAIPASCTATVGDAEDCDEDFRNLSDAQHCSDVTTPPASCTRLLECGFGVTQ
jgi:hypothetical protein